MAKLVVISKSLTGLTHELGRQWVTVGRSPGNALQLPEPSVSGQHAEFRWNGEELLVRDMHSTNGTFIEGNRVSEGVLKPGNTIRVGEVELRLELTAEKPVPPVVRVAPVAAASSTTRTTASDGVAARHKVLLVDDSMAFLETISELFEALSEGTWEIHKAVAADQALAVLQQHPIELAVLDINMPLLDGVQLLGIAHRRHPEVKMVVLTGNASESRRTTCLATGAELFLEKSATPDGARFLFNVLNDLLLWKQREGFSGTLRQVGLADVVQIQCLGRNSCVLEVRTAQGGGEIYIHEGVITHARTGELTGVPALNRLLGLSAGEFHVKPYQSPVEVTISGSWEMLVMEAARLRDEERIQPAGDDTVHLTTLPAPAADGDSQPETEDVTAPATEREKEVIDEITGDGFVVVSTYDGEWHLTNDQK
ncbi:MAG TPA: response regulator [Verrucomicrobiae bacterium]|nr:response regulator [Verrucomicrobiae bacterium]